MKKSRLFLVFLIVFLALSFFPNVFAPNFGYETKGTSTANGGGDYIRGSWFSCSESGTATSITVYLKQYSTNTPKIKCAIYKKSDDSLVGYTEEWTMTSDWDDWKTFNIVWGGDLTAQDYYIVFWVSDYALKATYYYVNEADKSAIDSHTYNGFPNPWYPNVAGMKISIYCTYTTDGGQEKTFGLSETCGVSDSLDVGKEKASFLDGSCGVELQTVIGKEKGSYFSETTLTETDTGITKEKLIVFSRSFTITSLLGMTKEQKLTLVEIFETVIINANLIFESEIFEEPLTGLGFAVIALVIALFALVLALASVKVKR